jgi:hypothetical protein
MGNESGKSPYLSIGRNAGKTPELDGLWVGVICALIFNEKDMALRNKNQLARRMCLASLVLILALMFSFAWFDHLHFLASAVNPNLLSVAFGALLLAVGIGDTPITRNVDNRYRRLVTSSGCSISRHKAYCGCCSMVGHQLPKLWARACEPGQPLESNE